VIMALVATQAFGATLAVTMVIVSGEVRPSEPALFWAGAAGASGLVGLAGLFLALSRGAMGLVAPLTAAVAAAVPAIVGVIGGDQLGPLVLLGMLLALGAVVAVAMPDRSRGASDATLDSMPDVAEGGSTPARAGRLGEWGLIVMAGLGFAGFFLGVDRAGDEGSGVWWTLAAARLTSLAIIVIMTAVLVVAGRAPSVHGLGGVLPLLVLSAVGDTGGNLFFVLSRAETTLAVAVVLSSLYPVSTAILARVVLHERLSRLAMMGVILAVAGVVLIGFGSTTG
jgi:drug/metabolite transporter (DMT)-like permease